jgi:hypothetical protein
VSRLFRLFFPLLSLYAVGRRVMHPFPAERRTRLDTFLRNTDPLRTAHPASLRAQFRRVLGYSPDNSLEGNDLLACSLLKAVYSWACHTSTPKTFTFYHSNFRAVIKKLRRKVYNIPSIKGITNLPGNAVCTMPSQSDLFRASITRAALSEETMYASR